MSIGRYAAAAFLAVAGLAAAPAAAPAGGDKIVFRFERVLAELDLTEEQRARVLGLRQHFEADMRALTEALQRRAADLRGRIDERPGEPRTIEELVQEIGRTQTEILRVRVRAIRDLREVLSPRQQARLRELEESMRRAGEAAAPR